MTAAESIHSIPASDDKPIRVYQWKGSAPVRGITPFDWLSRDKAVVDAYIADPLCGFNVNAESYGSLFAVALRLSTVQEISRIRQDLPMFLFVGDLDPVNAKLTWFQPLIDRYREGDLTDVSWHVYGNARHEVLNEINRPEVVTNLQAWIDRVTGSSAPK
jgi:alpha-beta hydrolase superfamily lysophospholipase